MTDLRLALYCPDIPQNTGAAIRLCACLGLSLDIIEPCGFIWKDKHIKKAALDYGLDFTPRRHASWDDFIATYGGSRRILALTTKSERAYTEFKYKKDDILLMGRESAGLPDEVHNSTDARLTIPMVEGARSLNVINAASMVMGEALRQTGFTLNQNL